MAGLSSTLSQRQSLWAFVLGCIAVTTGVVLHLPMVAMARAMNYRLSGMPMDAAMMAGMGLIVSGVVVAAYGLLPRDVQAQREAAAHIVVAAPEDAELSAAHWRLMLVLVVALIIDVMKPASLGFTVPGMMSEYGVSKQGVSLVPFFALLGTVVGSLVWGLIADVYGRKASILLSAVLFVGTSICGAMPSLGWNIAMCFMMGAAAGGMLPVTYALLAEMMPSRHRGWSLVLVGGLGASGGYFAASAISAWLQPIFGWRILWLMNLPTGLALLLLGGWIPESAKFLLARGSVSEAERIMRRFGSVARKNEAVRPELAQSSSALAGLDLIGSLAALTTCAIAWGLVNFGLLLWLPAELVAKGYSVGLSSKLLAQSALIAFPTVFLCAVMYSRWSTKWTLAVMVIVTFLGLLGIVRMGPGSSPLLPVALLIVGANGIIATLLPYAAESFPLRVRGRTTGWVAACTKGGGLLAQAMTISGIVVAIGPAAGMIMILVAISLALIVIYGRETRGRDLRNLEADIGQIGQAVI